MKKIRTFSFIAVMAISFILLLGCGDQVSKDLENYIENQMPALETAEENIINSFNSELNNKSSGDDALLKALNEEVIPCSDELIEAAKAVEPKTDELNQVHAIYIDAMTSQNQGFKKLAEAISNNSNADMAKEANALLTKSDETCNTFVKELHKLADEHDYEIN